MIFRFKGFDVMQQEGVHKVGTDGVLLGAWFLPHDEHHILDIGTGTGVIALMAAQRTGALVTAIDSDAESAAVAGKNFMRSPWSNRLSATPLRLQDLGGENLFSHILSNPPFFMDSLLPDDPARLRQRHAEELTFVELASAVVRMLAPGGRFSVILPCREGEHFASLASEEGLTLSRLCMVHPRDGKPAHRLLMEFGREGTALQTEVLHILGKDGTYTPEYRSLTRDFYLGF
ncbi:MAG: tRNA1(Val) (adenine(37)-N6)-methyltransferase [Bacteroidota bacterium]